MSFRVGLFRPYREMTTTRAMKTMYVYILKCTDDTYYTGVTNNITRRFNEHMTGKSETAYTNSRRPLELVYSRKFYGPLEAIAFEKRLKKWSQKKKEALINEQYELLPGLSKKKFRKKLR